MNDVERILTGLESLYSDTCTELTNSSSQEEPYWQGKADGLFAAIVEVRRIVNQENDE
jgi:hypothetical protein